MVLRISLSESQEEELTDVLLHHPKPYMREKASAILKLNSGLTGLEIAFVGLLKKRRKNTVYNWVHRYLENGLDSLPVKTGRGPKPSFFPPERGGSGDKTSSDD